MSELICILFGCDCWKPFQDYCSRCERYYAYSHRGILFRIFHWIVDPIKNIAPGFYKCDVCQRRFFSFTRKVVCCRKCSDEWVPF